MPNQVEQILQQAVAERRQQLNLANGQPPGSEGSKAGVSLPQMNWTAITLAGITGVFGWLITRTITANNPEVVQQKIAAADMAQQREASTLIVSEAMKSRTPINICIAGWCPEKPEPKTDTYLQGQTFSARSTTQPPVESAPPTTLPPAPAPTQIDPPPAQPDILYASNPGKVLSASTGGSTAYYDLWRTHWQHAYQQDPVGFKQNPNAYQRPDSTADQAFWDVYYLAN